MNEEPKDYGIIEKLDVGSGNMPMEGWTTFDLYVDADIRGDLLHMPFGDGTVRNLRSEHTLEHLKEGDVPKALAEFYRVLVLGGNLFLYLPDLEWTVKQWLEKGDKSNWDVWWRRIFGSQIRLGEFHNTGFTLEKSKRQVQEAKFILTKAGIVFTHRHNQPEIQIEAVK